MSPDAGLAPLISKTFATSMPPTNPNTNRRTCHRLKQRATLCLLGDVAVTRSNVARSNIPYFSYIHNFPKPCPITKSDNNSDTKTSRNCISDRRSSRCCKWGKNSCESSDRRRNCSDRNNVHSWSWHNCSSHNCTWDDPSTAAATWDEKSDDTNCDNNCSCTYSWCSRTKDRQKQRPELQKRLQLSG